VRRVDGYLSRRAQTQWPRSLVYEDLETGQFVLERPQEEILALGDGFSRAVRAIQLLMTATGQEVSE